jgi:hypothetical protein
VKHADANNIMYPLHHGFRRGLSCETQLLEFIDDISKNLDTGKQQGWPEFPAVITGKYRPGKYYNA